MAFPLLSFLFERWSMTVITVSWRKLSTFLLVSFLEQMKCINACIIDVGVVVNDYYAPFIREFDELASLKKKESILAIWQLSGLVFS